MRRIQEPWCIYTKRENNKDEGVCSFHHFPTVMGLGWAAYHFFSRFSRRRRSTNPYSFPQVFSHQATTVYWFSSIFSALLLFFSLFVCFIDSSSKQQQTSWAFVSYSSSSVFLPRLTLSWLACAQRVLGAFRDGRTGAATPQCPDVRVSPRDETRQEHGK